LGLELKPAQKARGWSNVGDLICRIMNRCIVDFRCYPNQSTQLNRFRTFQIANNFLYVNFLRGDSKYRDKRDSRYGYFAKGSFGNIAKAEGI